MEAQSAMPWPCVCNFLCLAVTALFWKSTVKFISYWPLTCYDKYIYRLKCACCCLLSPELWHNCILMMTCMCSKLMIFCCCCCCWFFWICPGVSIQIQGVHSNPSTNQLTEKKHSKRKTPYRPLERTEPLKKAGWKTETQSVKRSTQKKNGTHPSINENKNHYHYKQEAG